MSPEAEPASKLHQISMFGLQVLVAASGGANAVIAAAAQQFIHTAL
jgi:hypothetical protein